jgi:hypothetical protein
MDTLEEYAASIFRAEVWRVRTWSEYTDKLQGRLSLLILPQTELSPLPLLRILAEDAAVSFSKMLISTYKIT